MQIEAFDTDEESPGINGVVLETLKAKRTVLLKLEALAKHTVSLKSEERSHFLFRICSEREFSSTAFFQKKKNQKSLSSSQTPATNRRQIGGFGSCFG